MRIFCTFLLLLTGFSCFQGTTMAQVNLPVLGDSVSGTITSREEYEFGREFLRSVRNQTPALDDPLIEEYIESLSYRLAANSELKDPRLEFILIDSQMLNAFAAPGGIIGVNAGLFLYAQNEGQFASVLAHELAHISQRHYARQIEQARINALPNLAATLASLLVLATVDGEAGQAALATTQSLSLENRLRFSRSNEHEADRVGIRTLYNAGFDPMDMAGMFEQMLRQRSYSQRLPEFLSTHPLDEARVADSVNRANTYPGVSQVPNIEYLLMQQRVVNHYTRDHDDRISELQSQLPQLRGQAQEAALYGMALAQLNSGQFVSASESLSPLLRKDPNRISYVTLQAEIASQAGNNQLAIALLEDHLEINPDNYPLTTLYARTLMDMEQYDKAAEVLASHTSINPEKVQLWNMLAEANGKAGNISGVHQAQAEYFLAIGEFGRAIDQLNYARNLENDPLKIARLQERLNYIRELGNRFYR